MLTYSWLFSCDGPVGLKHVANKTSDVKEGSCLYIVYTSVSQTVVPGGPQAVSEEKALKNGITH
jgi:hypothetical protein